MNLFRQIYKGKDLVISQETLEAMGFRPGDTVIVRSQQTSLEAVPITRQERARRRQVLERLANAWEASDLTNFDQQRQAMWQQWTAFNS